MSVFGGLLGTSNIHPLDPQRFFMMDWGGRQTKSGKSITPENALTHPAYFAAIRVISEDVGKVGLLLYNRDLEGRTKNIAFNNPDYKVLRNRVNPNMSSQQFRELMIQWAMNWGGGVAEIVWKRGKNEIDSLYPIHPSRVQIKMQDNEKFYIIQNDSGQEPTVLSGKDVLHFRGFGDSDNGYSLASYIAETIGVGLAAAEFGSAFLGNSMRASGVLKTEAKHDANSEQNLRESWKSYMGSDNTGSVPILWSGLEWQPLSINPDEAQFIETIKHNVEDIARACRVNPNKLQDWERATYNNMEQANTDHVMDALMPWFVRIEEEINYKIYDNDPGVFVKHDVNELLRGDMASRSEFKTKGFRNGEFTINELRDMEDMNPIENGDNHYVTADLIPVDMVGVNTEQVDNKSKALIEPGINNVLTKMINKEDIACNKAINKWNDNADDNLLDDWSSNFFDIQRQEYIKQLSPIVDTYSKSLGDNNIDIDAVITDYCGEMIDKIIMDKKIESSMNRYINLKNRIMDLC